MHVRRGLDRARDLDRMEDTTLDVLVVGAGATGAGVALDAATRGLQVGLVDRGDVANGTSSKSSKLIHGGLRYLAHGDLPMVAEGVRERERLRRTAPHLVRPLGFVVPTDTVADAALLGAGMLAYDTLATGRAVARSRRLSAAEVVQQAPALAKGFDRGGVRYFDAQTDDARLVLQVAMTARRHGALVATHVVVDGIDPGRDGVVVTLRPDAERAVEVRARHVVLAGGVWADHTGLVADVGFATTPARGAHLTFPRDVVPVSRATVIPSANGDGRRLFLVPWGDQVYVGTNDVPDPDGRAGAVVTDADAAYLLAAVNDACGLSLTPTDAIGAWAGLRPLVAATADEATADLSRRHVVTSPTPGVWAVTGGKLTTYRQIAEDVVDAVLAADGRTAACRTPSLALGATGDVAAARARVHSAAAAVDVPPGTADTVWHRHGDRAVEVLQWCADRPDGREPAVPGLAHLHGELAWAVEVEGARTIADVLSRRLRASDRDAAAGGAAVEDVADLLASPHGWDDEARNDAVAAYRREVTRERGPVPLR